MGALAAGTQGDWLAALAVDAAAIRARTDELAASSDAPRALGATLLAAEGATTHSRRVRLSRPAAVICASWRRTALTALAACEGRDTGACRVRAPCR